MTFIIDFLIEDNLQYFLSKEADHKHWIYYYILETTNTTITLNNTAYPIIKNNEKILFSYKKPDGSHETMSPYPIISSPKTVYYNEYYSDLRKSGLEREVEAIENAIHRSEYTLDILHKKLTHDKEILELLKIKEWYGCN